jgi:hypothetical protein
MSTSSTKSRRNEHEAEKACPARDPEWTPTLRRDHAQANGWSRAEGKASCSSPARKNRQGIDVDRVYTGRWSRDQAAEAYRLIDQCIDGKGVFLM